MAENNIKNSFVSLTVTDFGGINRTSASEGAGMARDIRNFRILADGSLKRRGGFAAAGVLPESIRASWAGMLDGAPRLVLLAGGSVYSLDPADGVYSEIGAVGTSEGAATFFMLEGRLYLKDASGLYRIGEDAVCEAGGYIPLYGNEWIPSSGGEAYEPVNQMSEYVRIRYKANVTTSTLYTGFNAVEAVMLYIHGGDTYTEGFNISGKNVHLPTAIYSGTIAELCIRIAPSNAEREALDSCTGAAVYGGHYDTCVYCFSGDDPARVFRSRYVKKEDVQTSQLFLAGAGELYFPVGDDYYVASGGAQVSAVCRHYDRLLIFGLDDARMTDLSEDVYQDTPAMPINTGVGCLNSDGVALCENDPVTVSRDGIYRWTANTDERDESSAVMISEPLGDLMTRGYREGAFIFNHRELGELWIGNPQDDEGRVFVYNYRSGKWYCFTGIRAERFFVYDGMPGFCRGGEVFIFDGEAEDDCGESFEAVYESRYTDMGKPEREKRIKRCRLVGTGGGAVSLELIVPGGLAAAASLGCGGDEEPGLAEIRCPTRRFSHLRYRIKSVAAGQRIVALILTGSR